MNGHSDPIVSRVSLQDKKPQLNLTISSSASYSDTYEADYHIFIVPINRKSAFMYLELTRAFEKLYQKGII